MPTQLHNELKREFQLERLILFSDAVFAIAITLLIIEIKVPEVEHEGITEKHLLESLAGLIPKFIGFLISFFFIGQYWIVHHRLFGFVINFTERLIWLNILFLAGIVLMPFSTALYSEYFSQPVISPIIFYTSNIALIGMTNFFLWRYISKPKLKLSENLTPSLSRYFSLRALTVPFIFILASFVYLYSRIIAYFIPMLIPVVMRLFFGPMKKKLLNEKNKL